MNDIFKDKGNIYKMLRIIIISIIIGTLLIIIGLLLKKYNLLLIIISQINLQKLIAMLSGC